MATEPVHPSYTSSRYSRSGALHNLYRVADILQSLFPLSMRGLIILLILAYLFLNPIWSRSDIVASSLTSTVFGIVVLFLVICAYTGYKLKRKLNPQLVIPRHSEGSRSEAIIAGKQNKFLLQLGPFSIAPLFNLSIEIRFEHAGATRSCHIVSYSADPLNPINCMITFPHRGQWKLSSLRLNLEDRFGFTCMIWSDTSLIETPITVHPEKITHTTLPIISSTLRAGDDISHHTQRMGEPFDIKPYQPSDGIRKILWKVFAKRGELMARHPEHAVTPEGHVIAFVLAQRYDDQLASWAHAYFTDLAELNLTMEVGCLGMQNLPLAHDPQAVEDLLIQSAFNAPITISRSDAEQIVERISARSISSHFEQVDTIALFLSDSIFSTAGAAEEIVALVDRLVAQGINPVLCFHRSADALIQVKPRTLFERLIYIQPDQNMQSDPNPVECDIFLKACYSRQLRIYQEHGNARSEVAY